MDSQKLLPIPDAVELETGRRPSPPTAYRWVTRGSRGVRLMSQVLGGRRYTTRQAVRDFIDASTAARVVATDMPEMPRSEAATSNAIAQAETELRKHGI